MQRSDQPSIGLTQTSPVQCNNCNGLLFNQTLMLRKAPGLLVGNKEDSYMPIPVFSCVECNHVNQEFLPVEIKNEQKEKTS